MNPTQITITPMSDGDVEIVIQDLVTKKLTMEVIDTELAEGLVRLASALKTGNA